MSAVTSSVSPTSRLTGYRPPSNSGWTSPIQTLRTSPRGDRYAMASRSVLFRCAKAQPALVAPSRITRPRSARPRAHEGSEQGADVVDAVETDRSPAGLRAHVHGQGALGERREQVLVGPIVTDGDQQGAGGGARKERRNEAALVDAPGQDLDHLRACQDVDRRGSDETLELALELLSLAAAKLRVGEPVVPGDPRTLLLDQRARRARREVAHQGENNRAPVLES